LIIIPQIRETMLTKADIQTLKQENIAGLYKLLDPAQGNMQQLLFVLEHLGPLPRGFNGDLFLLVFQSTSNATLQYWAIKNLAKLGDYSFINALQDIVFGDYDSLVRREAASAIGRMRDKRTIPVQLKTLHDSDPNIILQAVRGLLVFKGRAEVDEALKALKAHPNENIQTLITREYFPKTKSSNTAHVDSPAFLRNIVVLGDVLQVLPHVPDESIHLTFTSPPYYNARDYSIYPSYEHYLAFLREVFQAVHRITKEGRFCIINTSPVIIPRISRAHASRRYPIPFDIHRFMMELDWEFIDDIVWMKPEASVKNRNGGFQQHRKPLGYKPNAVTEYLMVYRKKTDKLIDWNMRQYPAEIVDASKVTGDFETTNVWQIDPTFDRTHSAVFPVELCHRVIQYYSYVGDLIFDPFAGSGTLGKAALDLNRYYFLTEQNEDYFKRIKERLSDSLFHTARFVTLDTFSEER
jgi:DNA modification methylase